MNYNADDTGVNRVKVLCRGPGLNGTDFREVLAKNKQTNKQKQTHIRQKSIMTVIDTKLRCMCVCWGLVVRVCVCVPV